MQRVTVDDDAHCVDGDVFGNMVTLAGAVVRGRGWAASGYRGSRHDI